MQHETVFESREEREAEGRPVDPKWMQDNNMVQAMGGLRMDSHIALASGEDVAQMRDPQMIVGNINNHN